MLDIGDLDKDSSHVEQESRVEEQNTNTTDESNPSKQLVRDAEHDDTLRNDQPNIELQAYPLQRDFQASMRLYFQYWMWRRQLGYQLHSKIALQTGHRVADVCCGTGIWLLDLAREHPEISGDEYDISSEQFPVPRWLPANVHLSKLDIHKPIREHLKGRYDVVHVGLLVLVVQEDDPIPILQNLKDLLKPGGYLQWDESEFGNLTVSSPAPSISCQALEKAKQRVRDLMFTVKGARFHWVSGLRSYFHQIGLDVVEDRYLTIADDIALPWTLQHLMALVEVIRGLDQPPGSAKDWWELCEAAAEETFLGASMRMAMISFVGQRKR